MSDMNNYSSLSWVWFWKFWPAFYWDVSTASGEPPDLWSCETPGKRIKLHSTALHVRDLVDGEVPQLAGEEELQEPGRVAGSEVVTTHGTGLPTNLSKQSLTSLFKTVQRE